MGRALSLTLLTLFPGSSASTSFVFFKTSTYVPRQHNNTHPFTKEPLEPTDLITLHYSHKEASNEIHDPVSFKPFSEHSHIVAVATTGNVYLAESVRGNRDLLADISIKKYAMLLDEM